MNKLLLPTTSTQSNRNSEPNVTHPRMKWSRFAILTLCFITIAAYAISRWTATWNHPYRPIELQGQWIQAPEDSSSGYFRKRFDLTGSVRHAWIMVAANEGFEVTVNCNPVGRQYLWRPTRPFQTGASEIGQRVIPSDAALALNFPRAYQWSGHRNSLLPTFLDITRAGTWKERHLCRIRIAIGTGQHQRFWRNHTVGWTSDSRLQRHVMERRIRSFRSPVCRLDASRILG